MYNSLMQISKDNPSHKEETIQQKPEYLVLQHAHIDSVHII